MIVTDLQYAIENRLVRKLDMMIQRCEQEEPEKDALIINEGAEGEGKTNTSVCEAYYVKHKTGREAHLFFRLQPMIDFAKKTEKKIIIWDEPALDSLKADSMGRINRDLQRLLMTVRKKRHFFIFNLTKFYKFNEYIVVDRNLGLIHMYSRKEKKAGRFFYIKKKKLESLYNGYTFKKKRMYGKLKSFGGEFPPIMKKHFDKMDFFVNGIPHATYEIYNQEKDKSIASIGETNEAKPKRELEAERKLRELRLKIAKLKGLTKKELASQLQVSETRLYEWSHAIFAEDEGSKTTTAPFNYIIGVKKGDFPQVEEA